MILLSECLYSDVMKYVKREDVFVSQPSITMSVFLWYYWRLCSIICLVMAMALLSCVENKATSIGLQVSGQSKGKGTFGNFTAFIISIEGTVKYNF